MYFIDSNSIRMTKMFQDQEYFRYLQSIHFQIQNRFSDENEKAQLKGQFHTTLDQLKELEKQNAQMKAEKVVHTENIHTITENPWIVESIYEFQFYNCPTCSYRHYSKQEFVNHSFYNHLDSVIELQNISDGSLSDIISPWDYSNDYDYTSDDTSKNELKDNDDIMEI